MTNCRSDAAELLRAGRLVVFPTETVYGLGANALDADAVRRIFEAKGRPLTSPLIVHVDSIEMARGLAREWPEAAEKLARRFWPGPLTIIVPKASMVPDIVTAGLPSVGLRMPAHPMALDLLRAAGIPLAAPSANRFTELSPTAAEHVSAGPGGSGSGRWPVFGRDRKHGDLAGGRRASNPSARCDFADGDRGCDRAGRGGRGRRIARPASEALQPAHPRSCWAIRRRKAAASGWNSVRARPPLPSNCTGACMNSTLRGGTGLRSMCRRIRRSGPGFVTG